MTLKDFFSKYTLTSEQNSLLSELENFLTNKKPCFLLKGYAGTGKTFMMKGLTDFLTESKRSFILAAPTGRAAKIISQKTKHKANTIHKTIYSSTELKEFKVEDENGTETFKFYYELKRNEDRNNTIYIIDEASMLSDVYSEGEFFRFGSGFLLKDLIQYINIDHNDHSKKIIFIGDFAQLPPVNMNFSPALDNNYLHEKFNLTTSDFELTEVVRQKADSGILQNATKFRESLKANTFNHLVVESSFKDTIKTRHEELLSKYIQACNNTVDEETIIVAYSNSSVKEYNDFVRNHFFPNQKTITVGDKVILNSNNYNCPQMELLNGDFGIVKEVALTSETKAIKLKRKNGKNETVEIDVPLTFRDVTITFTDENFNKHDIKCKIIENLLYSHHRDLSSDELKAIYIDFKIRNPKLRPGTKEFKDAIRSDTYFNALRIKFGYAITCHKAQGGEWSNTFLNCKTSMGYLNSSYFRWLYTGFTRAKGYLFLIDEPHFTIGSKLQPPKIENIELKQDVLILDSNVLDLDVPFDFSNEAPFTKHIFLAVNEYLKDKNISISIIRHTKYLEHYTFLQENEAVIFKINYNAKNRITAIQKPANTSELAENIHAILRQLQNKTIVISELEAEIIAIEFEHDFLKEFYENIKRKLEPLNFQITKIEHKPYHEIYEIKRNGFVATYKFWYDGKCNFKKTEVVPSRTTGLVEEINKLLKEDIEL